MTLDRKASYVSAGSRAHVVDSNYSCKSGDLWEPTRGRETHVLHVPSSEIRPILCSRGKHIGWHGHLSS